MIIVLVSLSMTYLCGVLVNLSLFIALAVQEFVLYRAGKYKGEQKIGYKEILKRVLTSFLRIISSWGFWLTRRHIIDDFYIMED